MSAVAPPAPPIAPEPPPSPSGGSSDRFVRPGLGWNLLLQPGIIVTVVLAFSKPAYDAAAAKAPLPPQSRLKALAAGAVGLHVFEGLIAWRTAKGKGYTGSAKRWGIEGFLLGFPVLLKLRKQPIR